MLTPLPKLVATIAVLQAVVCLCQSVSMLAGLFGAAAPKVCDRCHSSGL